MLGQNTGVAGRQALESDREGLKCFTVWWPCDFLGVTFSSFTHDKTVVASQNYCNDHAEYLRNVLGVIAGPQGTENDYSAGNDGSDGALTRDQGKLFSLNG